MFDLHYEKKKRKVLEATLSALSETQRRLPTLIEGGPLDFGLSFPSTADAAEAASWTLNWPDNYAEWERLPFRTGVAIRSQGMLCGLAIGSFHKKMSFLGLTMMERNPIDGNPFKGHVLDTVDLFGLISCELIGANELRLFNPDKDVIPYYLNNGYDLKAGNPPYCVKQV